MGFQAKASVLLSIAALMGLSWTQLAEGQTAPPTGPRDLVVLVAREKPDLYRLVGQEPVPYGTARFHNPKAIVADAQRGCFYVIDEPRLLTEKVKLWRIAGDGSARVVLQADTAKGGGPFGLDVGLGLDGQGRPLIADRDSGLWRLNTGGQLQQLLQSKDKPLIRMTAATGSGDGWLVATSHLHETSQNSAGMILVHKNQGGLFQINSEANPLAATCLIENRRPGSEEYDTYWRRPTHLFIDAAGRIVLVDAGSTRTSKEPIYTGARRRSQYSLQRVTTSIIGGGVFVRHPDGRFEDLTFKTPDESSGPMRRPTGASQWSDDTYIVADPEMHVEGINGTGGLLLLKLDGSREARWPFGYHIQPVGVAILRGAGTPAQAAPVRPIRIEDLAGVHTAGRIARIESVSWECKPANTNDPVIGIGMGWDAQPRDKAEAKLREVFEGARWSIAADGAIGVCANGVDPQAEGTPLVMNGKVTATGQLLTALAHYRGKSMFDTQVGSVDARLRGGAEPGTIEMDVTINVFTKTERLKGAFTQTMPGK